MGTIRKLSDELANQIAAGEVVERPASVVKELLENALDANSTRISVDVEQGGSLLIRVSDDGDGMSEDDAVLALERHATSKIARLEDLFKLSTFGFRGEALPSIASVSKLLLRTRLRDPALAEACEVSVEGGRFTFPGRARPAGGASGTTIEVKDLFFNVPARKKFLKATATESAHVGDVLLGAALARPDVTFTLSRDGRLVREYLRVASREERARLASAGEKLAHTIIEHGTMIIEATLAPPERARAGATGLALLVNGRPVRDRVLARAVANAYGSILDGGRYPVGVVWIDLPPELVDVNVHPQKAEVRFTDARGVFDAITRALHRSLAKAFALPDLGASPFARARLTPPTLKALQDSAIAARNAVTAPAPPGPPAPQGQTTLEPPTTLPRDAAAPLPLPETNLFAQRGVYGSLRYIGQVRGTFLLCEGEDGLYVLDQHAAAERVTFDRLRRSYTAQSVKTQRLLVPELVELAESDVSLFDERAEDVARLGLELRPVGAGSLAVHGVPAILRRAEPARMVRDLASELSREGGRAFRGAVDLVLATMACHGSLRAGDAVAPAEAQALLTALDDVDFAGHCPHGRPIVTRMAWSDLERRVGR